MKLHCNNNYHLILRNSIVTIVMLECYIQYIVRNTDTRLQLVVTSRLTTILCYAMLCYATLRLHLVVTSRLTTILCYAMLCYAMLCYAMLRYATLRYATLRYATLHYTILYYTILYYTILYYTIQRLYTIHNRSNESTN